MKQLNDVSRGSLQKSINRIGLNGIDGVKDDLLARFPELVDFVMKTMIDAQIADGMPEDIMKKYLVRSMYTTIIYTTLLLEGANTEEDRVECKEEKESLRKPLKDCDLTDIANMNMSVMAVQTLGGQNAVDDFLLGTLEKYPNLTKCIISTIEKISEEKGLDETETKNRAVNAAFIIASVVELLERANQE